MNHASLTCFFLIALVNSLFAQYQLEKSREFTINSLNAIEIVDYDPNKKMFIGYERGKVGYAIVLMNEDGKILKTKSISGQGPGQFNSAMNFLGFSDNGDIWVITPNQLLAYDINLNFIESKKFVLDNPIFTSGNTESPTFFYKGNLKDNLVFATSPSFTSRFMLENSLEKQYLIELFDMKSQKSYFLAAIAERPIYKHFDTTIKTLFKPIFVQDKKNDRLFVTASLDNQITVIDLQSGKTFSNIKINHGDFGSFKKFPITGKNLPSYPPYSLASINMKILSLDGGLIILDYVREIPYGTFEKLFEVDKYYHHFNDPEYHRLIIFDQNNQLSDDLKIPYGHIQIALPNNSILIKLINPDEEEDFIRYGVFKVVKN